MNLSGFYRFVFFLFDLLGLGFVFLRAYAEDQVEYDTENGSARDARNRQTEEGDVSAETILSANADYHDRRYYGDIP
jgi:hypothetical protein